MNGGNRSKFIYRTAKSSATRTTSSHNVHSADSGAYSEETSAFTPRKKLKADHDGGKSYTAPERNVKDVAISDQEDVSVNDNSIYMEDFDLEDFPAEQEEELTRIEIEASQKLATPPKSESDVLESRKMLVNMSKSYISKGGNENCIPKVQTPKKESCNDKHAKLQEYNLNAAYAKIKELKEEAFSRSGEVGVLRATIEKLHAEEKAYRLQIKELSEQKDKVESDKILELKKQVERLKTRLQFTEKEFMDIVEQNKKQQRVQTQKENSLTTTNSPGRKNSQLSFERKSPKGRNAFSSPDSSKRNLSCASPPKQSSLQAAAASSPSSLKSRTVAYCPVEDAELRCLVNSKQGEPVVHELVQPAVSGSYTVHDDSMPQRECLSLFQLIPDSKIDCSSLYVQDQDAHQVLTSAVPLFDSQSSSPLDALSPNIDPHCNSCSSLSSLIAPIDSCFLHSSEVDTISSGKTRTSVYTDDLSCMLQVLEAHILGYCVERFDRLDLSSSPSNQVPALKGSSAVCARASKQEKLGKPTLFYNALKAMNLLSQLLKCYPYLRKLVFCQSVDENAQSNDSRWYWTSQGPARTHKGKDFVEDFVYKPAHLLQALFKLSVPIQGEPHTLSQRALDILACISWTSSSDDARRLKPLLTDGLLYQYLGTVSSTEGLICVLTLLVKMSVHQELISSFCSKSESCLLLRIYQSLYSLPDVFSLAHRYTGVYKQFVDFVSAVCCHTKGHSILLETECPCSLELLKCLVLAINKVFTSFTLSKESIAEKRFWSDNEATLPQGINLLIWLSAQVPSFMEHKVEVEHEFVSLLRGALKHYKDTKVPETEVNNLQDFLYDNASSPDEDGDEDEEDEEMEVDQT